MIEVHRSAVIPASAEQVWALLRDFNAMPEWNAAARSSVLENGPADRIGCRRVLTFEDGSVWTHELTGLSDAGLSISYAIVEPPAGARPLLRNYRATISVQPMAGDAACMVDWQARFDADDETAARERAAAVFQAGFDGLTQRFGR
jgi:uncharacterized protein YndB with AHSA1/START domain